MLNPVAREEAVKMVRDPPKIDRAKGKRWGGGMESGDP